MSKKEKLISRFCSLPSDFTFDELVRLFGYLGFELNNKGTTSGSRVLFHKGIDSFDLHKPHPGNTLGRKTMLKIYKYLLIRDLL
jgi:hypothetical protein